MRDRFEELTEDGFRRAFDVSDDMRNGWASADVALRRQRWIIRVLGAVALALGAGVVVAW